MRYRRVFLVSALTLGAGALTVAAGTMLAWGMGSIAPLMKAVETDERILPVEARKVRYRDDYRMQETFAGNAVARRTSDLGFETGGRLAELLVDEGDEVRADQPLARLDRRQLEARREELAAHLELARLTEQRRGNLLKRNNASQQSYDEARLQAEAMQAELKAVQIQLDLAELKSPYDAVVVSRLADEGTVTQPGQPILKVNERGAWEARIGLPPATAARLKRGDRFRLTVSGVHYTGVLRHILPEIDRTTRTALALFDIEGDTGRLRSGALARVAVATEVPARGFWLPVTALTEGRRGLWTAYVIGGEDPGGPGPRTGTAQRRQLQIIHTETDRAYVRGAVRDGEYVITAGVHRIVPGQRVRMLSAVSAN